MSRKEDSRGLLGAQLENREWSAPQYSFVEDRDATPASVFRVRRTNLSFFAGVITLEARRRQDDRQGFGRSSIPVKPLYTALYSSHSGLGTLTLRLVIRILLL